MIINPTDDQLSLIKGIIYSLRNKVNDKRYIGQSLKSFWGKDTKNARYSKNKFTRYISNTELKQDIQFFGLENFEIILLEIGIKTRKELNDLETKYIKYFDCILPKGYNYNRGGAANIPLTRKKIYFLKDYRNNFYIIYHSCLREFCRRMKLNVNSMHGVFGGRLVSCLGFGLPETNLNLIKKPFRRIYEIEDPNGNIHKTDNLGDFCRKWGLIYDDINRVANGHLWSTKGWKLPGTVIKHRKRRLKFIRIKNLKNNLIIESSSMLDISEKLGVNDSQIRQLLYGKKQNVKGYILDDFEFTWS